MVSERSETKACPDCAETVKAEARVCRFCGYRFEPPFTTERPAPVLAGSAPASAPALMLGPFERWLQTRVPARLFAVWLLGLRGLGPAPTRAKLQSGFWLWLLFGWMTLIGLWVLWLFVRAGLLIVAALLTVGLLTVHAARVSRSRSRDQPHDA